MNTEEAEMMILLYRRTTLYCFDLTDIVQCSFGIVFQYHFVGARRQGLGKKTARPKEGRDSSSRDRERHSGGMTACMPIALVWFPLIYICKTTTISALFCWFRSTTVQNKQCNLESTVLGKGTVNVKCLWLLPFCAVLFLHIGSRYHRHECTHTLPLPHVR